MSKVQLQVLFKKMQKDDKKEVLEFHVLSDELPHANELIAMAGNIVVLNVTNCEDSQMNAEFKSLQRDAKKTALKFNVKTTANDKLQKLYKYAGNNVTVEVLPSQMSIDDYYDEEEESKVEVEAPAGQLDIFETVEETTDNAAAEEVNVDWIDDEDELED